MKLSKKIIALGTCLALGLPLAFSLTQKETVNVSATDGYTTYGNEDLGFVTRDPNDTRIVKGDADGGEQTKGNVLDAKSELHLNFKRTMANYWIGVGGFAVYSSSDTTIRFITLTKSANSSYGRNAQLSNLVMKTADGSEAMTDVYTDGKLFNDYTDFVIKFDLSDLSAAKVEFTATYNGKTYYPFNGNTRIDSYTYNTQPINFDSGERYMAMAGANATDSGVAILKFNTQYVPPAPASNKDFSTIISGATGVFDYNSIGDLTVSLPLSEQITSYSGYLNDHLSDWKDENNNPVNIGDAIVINGETFNYWINFNDTNLNIDSNNGHGIHQFPVYALAGGNPIFNPVTINVSASRIKFFFNTAFIPSDSITITFKANLFRSFYNNTVFTLENDLTFYSTLNTSNYGLPGSNILFTKAPVETVSMFSITNAADNGEKTASQGAKFRKYTLWTNIPRSAVIDQAFPHDHYRYMFENIMFNGKTLQYYNVWGRGNDKDFTDLTTPTMNLDYELDHPASGTKYNMVTYLNIATDQPNYVIFVEIPNKLMEDFGYNSYNFTIRDGSAWVSKDSSGNPAIIRHSENPFDEDIANAILELENYVDLSLYDTEDAAAISAIINEAKNDLYSITSLEEITTIVSNTKAAIDEFQTAQEKEEASHIAAFVQAMELIPDTITLDAECIQAVNNAKEAYLRLTAEEKAQVDDLVDELLAIDAQIEALRLEQYKDVVRQQIASEINVELYSGDNRTAIEGLIATAYSAIDSASNKEAIDSAYDALIAGVENIPTAIELAIEELDQIDLSIYREAQAQQVAGYIAEGKELIRQCNSATEVEQALERVLALIDKVLTDEEMTADEALVGAKETAKQELTNYANAKGKKNYTAENWQMILDYVDLGKFHIDTAHSQSAIDAALQEAKDNIDSVEVKPDDPVDPEPTPKPANKGCGGSIVATSITLSLLAVAGLALTLSKKRK